MTSPMRWKKGRGKLGPFEPLLGSWRAEADSDLGRVTCLRTFVRVLDGAYIQLNADWTYPGGGYKEIALIGVGPDGEVGFWSFTSDRKQSIGWSADVTSFHPLAVGFEADMPAGRARTAYWPHEEEGFVWVAQAHTKKGWRTMAEHHYSAVEQRG